MKFRSVGLSSPRLKGITCCNNMDLLDHIARTVTMFCISGATQNCVSALQAETKKMNNAIRCLAN